MTVNIKVGNALEVLRGMADESVHCCVTSPPYWGLRAYGGDPDMIGLEPTFEGHLENLVAVFREVRRVLRGDGTLFLNYGDAYSRGEGRGGSGSGDKQASNLGSSTVRPQNGPLGTKPKDLMMMPARVAIALQVDGWWVRSEIIWHKPSSMPESVTDRPTNAHEKVFLLTKAARYFYDAEAVRVRGSSNTHARRKDRQRIQAKGADPNDNRNGTWLESRSIEEQAAIGRNLRNVWTIHSHGFSEAHFATFPTALVDPCIRAGTSAKGACGECGKPWVRSVERKTDGIEDRPYAGNGQMKSGGREGTNGIGSSTLGQQEKVTVTTTGWHATCECNAEVRPATVLDPFSGAGTTGLVAAQLGRDAVLIELNPDYVEMAADRIRTAAPLLFHVNIDHGTVEADT